MKTLLRLLLVVLLTLTFFFTQADVRLPRLISDHMILQRGTMIRIWGWADPSETINVSLAGVQRDARADSKGNWSVHFPAMPAGGPFTLSVDGKNHLEINDVLIGDVWLCSGQSNMEISMERVKEKYANFISRSTNSKIRQFTVPDRYNFKFAEKDLTGGEWVSANPDDVLNFSAVAYFFALDIFEQFHVPIGLINSALGGSPAEAWISEDALINFPELLKEGQRFKNDKLIARIDSTDKAANADWFNKLSRIDAGVNRWSTQFFDDRDWSETNIPGYWADTKTGNVNGSVWFRRRIQVDSSMAGKAGHLWMGRIVDADSVFLNGKFVGSTGYQYPPRRYTFGPDILKAGENMIAVRVINTNGSGGFVPDKRYFLSTGTDTILLTGTWKYKVGGVLPPAPPQHFIRWNPFGLFNAMIAPLQNYNIKGVIWYQGEANTERAIEYEKLFPALIDNWRDKWKSEFPFLFVQLPNFMEEKSEPSESNWAALRQAQLKTFQNMHATGMVVAIDAGEWNDIHPLDKQTIGKRLALSAQRVAYGNKSVVYSGPVIKGVKIHKEKIEITFLHTGSGLKAKGGELKHFAIAGVDHVFYWANAKITGRNKVVVWNERIEAPLYVRYAWADNPASANLYNAEGLPASPFKTD